MHMHDETQSSMQGNSMHAGEFNACRGLECMQWKLRHAGALNACRRIRCRSVKCMQKNYTQKHYMHAGEFHGCRRIACMRSELNFAGLVVVGEYFYAWRGILRGCVMRKECRRLHGEDIGCMQGKLYLWKRDSVPGEYDVQRGKTLFV